MLKFNIEINNDEIHLIDKNAQVFGVVDYSEEMLKIVKDSSWTLQGGSNRKYIYSKKHGDYLHRIVMRQELGEENFKKLSSKGFVVDHLINSEPYNCKNNNLQMITSNQNKGKAFCIDHEISKVFETASISLARLSNNYIQVQTCFNKYAFIVDNKNKFIPIQILYLDFRNFDEAFIYILAALNYFKNPKNSQFNIFNYNAINIKHKRSLYLNVTENEKMLLLYNGITILYLI